jgi:hypothetical protein
MAVSAVTTALSTVLGSMLALLVFLHLRGDLTGMPFDGAASAFLAADAPLPLPAALTLLAVVPVTASAAVAVALRPKDPHRPARPRAYGRFGAYGRTGARETFGAYGRFGARWGRPGRATGTAPAPAADGTARESAGDGTALTPRGEAPTAPVPPAPESPAHPAPESPTHPAPPPADGTPEPLPNPTATLPWGITTLAAGLAVEAYATRGTTPTTLHLPGGLGSGPAAVLVGWVLTAIGLALAGPGLTHLCGRLLQAARPGALRLLAGRVLMAEATRIGRPLGIVCAVASAAYALPTLRPDGDLGPLTTLGGLLVAGCTVATLLTAAVEARQLRADTTAALLRLGAPAGMLRSAAALRAAALLAVFGPLTLIVAELAALPLAR